MNLMKYIKKISKINLLYVMFEGNIPRIIKRSKVSILTKQVNYKTKTLTINCEKPTFTYKNKNFIIVDINSGQIYLDKNFIDENDELIDEILSNSIISQLIKSNISSFNNWLMGLIFLVLGVCIGFIIKSFIGGF